MDSFSGLSDKHGRHFGGLNAVDCPCTLPGYPGADVSLESAFQPLHLDSPDGEIRPYEKIRAQTRIFCSDGLKFSGFILIISLLLVFHSLNKIRPKEPYPTACGRLLSEDAVYQVY